MASGNARGENKRQEDATENEIGSINAVRTIVGTALVVDDDGVGAKRLGAESPSTRARETECVAAIQECERDGETTNPRLRHVE